MSRQYRVPLTAAADVGHKLARARLITYNILTDVLCMTDKHSYASTADREWGGPSSGRCARILSEVRSYDADIICLQECSLKCFDEFCDSLRGYDGFHHSSFLSSKDDATLARQSETGLATFVRTAAWRPLAVRAHRLGALEWTQRHTGKLRKKLETLADSVLLLRLAHEPSGATLAVGNTHLHWDPNWPHLKASQGELAARALADFAVSTTRSTIIPSLVLAGDFNSVPCLQPSFLPQEQQEALPNPLPEEWRASALYHLLSHGTLPADHPECAHLLSRSLRPPAPK